MLELDRKLEEAAPLGGEDGCVPNVMEQAATAPAGGLCGRVADPHGKVASGRCPVGDEQALPHQG
jgi:hypothetical protein